MGVFKCSAMHIAQTCSFSVFSLRRYEQNKKRKEMKGEGGSSRQKFFAFSAKLFLFDLLSPFFFSFVRLFVCPAILHTQLIVFESLGMMAVCVYDGASLKSFNFIDK